MINEIKTFEQRKEELNPKKNKKINIFFKG